MSYTNWLQSLQQAFLNILDLLGTVLAYLMNNHIFKFLFHTLLLFFTINFVVQIIKLIKNIFAMKKEAAKNKVSSSSDIE